MNLDKWLKENRYTRASLGRELGLCKDYFYKVHKEFQMSTKVCQMITKFTGGNVTMKELRPDLFE